MVCVVMIFLQTYSTWNVWNYMSGTQPIDTSFVFVYVLSSDDVNFVKSLFKVGRTEISELGA